MLSLTHSHAATTSLEAPWLRVIIGWGRRRRRRRGTTARLTSTQIASVTWRADGISVAHFSAATETPRELPVATTRARRIVGRRDLRAPDATPGARIVIGVALRAEFGAHG